MPFVMAVTGQRFTTWLYTIASNLVKDRYRWRARHPQVSLDSENERTGSSLGELLPVAGIDYVGPLPREIQKVRCSLP